MYYNDMHCDYIIGFIGFSEIAEYNQLKTKQNEYILNTHCTGLSLVIECIHVCLVQ